MAGSADADYLVELFASFGPVSVRRMFSGAGIFADGLMIALVVDGVIYLKADESLVPLFQREGQTPFSYRSRNGSRTLNSYWRIPERLYDEPEEMAEWARRSMQVACRSIVKAGRGGASKRKRT